MPAPRFPRPPLLNLLRRLDDPDFDLKSVQSIVTDENQVHSRPVAFSDEEVRSAVDFADFGNMQKLEKSGQLSDWRFSENAEYDVDKLKVRRGKVKGYTDYFDEEQVAALEAMVADNLNGQFGY